MRLIMSGDKSRYHFFRSIVDLRKSKNQENFFTERLGAREVFLTSDLKKVNDDCFYSPKVPLNTDLYFPSEFVDMLDIIKNGDKIVWFDEFPYATDSDIEKIKEVIDSGKGEEVVIVLFQNYREKLETDISTDNMALEEAEFRYSQLNLPIYKFVPDAFPLFLLWENNIENSIIKENFHSKMKMIEFGLEVFDSSYEFMFDMPGEDGKSISSLADYDVLAGFCEYNRKLCKNNIWDVYHEKACKFYWDNNYAVKDFCKFIYKDAIESICIWDFEKDFERLYEIVIEEFRKITREMHPLVYDGGKSDYDEFLKENQEEIISYKMKIQHFFRENLKELIKARINRNLKKLEALYS